VVGLLDRKDKQATPLFIVVMAYITTSGVACLSAKPTFVWGWRKTQVSDRKDKQADH